MVLILYAWTAQMLCDAADSATRIRLLVSLLALLANGGTARSDPFDERIDERANLVFETIERRGVDQVEVLRAMRRVPRHAFVPQALTDYAYEDRPLPIGHGQTISQPYIVGYMTEVLGLQSGETVLEVGTGSGYQAAVLAEMTERVFTIEVIPELAVAARRRLDELGYTTVESKNDDGYHGWSDRAPFDAIIVTAAADHVPPPLIAQLAVGGVMIIPVGAPNAIQSLIRIRKLDDGTIERDGLLYVRFVPLVSPSQN